MAGGIRATQRDGDNHKLIQLFICLRTILILVVSILRELSRINGLLPKHFLSAHWHFIDHKVYLVATRAAIPPLLAFS
ncbi:MAG: hypothetical protein PVI06_07430 [Desulfobacterales bacterium]